VYSCDYSVKELNKREFFNNFILKQIYVYFDYVSDSWLIILNIQIFGDLAVYSIETCVQSLSASAVLPLLAT